MTVASAKDYSDLKLRFPLDYESDIKHIAHNKQLDPAHVYAVIRQESAFNKDARSPAGAMGLKAGTIYVTMSEEEVLIGGDIVLTINGIQITDMVALGEVRQNLNTFQTGDQLTIDVLREGRVVTLKYTMK